MPDRAAPPDSCANCGAPIPPRAQACPECGADERTGWRETSLYDGIDLPAEAWSDDAADATRAPRPSRVSIGGVPWYWWTAGVVLLLCLGAALLGLR